MKPVLPLLTTFGLLALATSQSGELAFRSQDGKFTLAPFSDFRIRQRQAELSFEGTGRGLTGEFEELSIRADRMTGTARRQGPSYLLRTLDAIGPTKATYRAANARDTITSDSAGMQYRVGESVDTVNLTGTVNLTMSEPGISRTIKLDGREGRLEVNPKLSGRERLRSAKLAGPVKIDLKQPAAEGRSGTDIVATGQILDYATSTSGATLTLSGNVRVVGNSDTLSGTATATRLIVRFLSTGEVDEVEMSGSPGQTRLSPPRTGGTR